MILISIKISNLQSLISNLQQTINLEQMLMLSSKGAQSAVIMLEFSEMVKSLQGENQGNKISNEE